jgi:hypothetical protein
MQRTSSGKTAPRRTVRFDPAPGAVASTGSGADAGAAGARGVLELFRAWIRSAPTERRQAARHGALGGRLWLGWWDSDRTFTAVVVEVRNISRGGALVHAAEPPQELREVWACLDGDEPTDCVAASVLAVEPVRPGAWSVRFEFSEPCPPQFLAASLVAPAPRTAGTV